MSDKLREALIAHEKKVVDMVLSCQGDPMKVNHTSIRVLASRTEFLSIFEVSPPSDAAQPEKVCPHCGCSPLREVASDAVPVAWRYQQKYHDPISGPWRVTASKTKISTLVRHVAKIQGAATSLYRIESLYTHPADAPRPDKASQGSTVSGGERPEQVEDAPAVTEEPCGCRWLGLWVKPCFEHIQLFGEI